VFASFVCSKLRSFERDVCILSVFLRVHRDIFTRGHGHSSGHKRGESRDQDIAAAAVRRSDAHDEARR
jgi:hypothetical protein